MIKMDQIIHITWCERKIKDTNDKQPRMLVIHISDLYQKHTLDNIYPVHFNQVYRGYMPVSESGRRIYFQGKDSFALYLLPDTILWVESTNNGRSSIIHTNNAEYHVKATTVELEREHPDFLIRCHRCHLVNPKHIVYIKRFNVTLSDGKEIPIPEKKYTAFRREAEQQKKKKRVRSAIKNALAGVFYVSPMSSSSISSISASYRCPACSRSGTAAAMPRCCTQACPSRL